MSLFVGMNWEQPDWDVDGGWALEKVDAPKKQGKRNRDRAASKKEPLAKKQKVEETTIADQAKNENKQEEETETMTSSMKRRLRRKKNKLNQMQPQQPEPKSPAVEEKKQVKAKKKGSKPAETQDQKKKVKETDATLVAMKEKLKSGQFRWLNEQLYTTNSEEAMKLFSEEPDLFQAVSIVSSRVTFV